MLCSLILARLLTTGVCHTHSCSLRCTATWRSLVERGCVCGLVHSYPLCPQDTLVQGNYKFNSCLYQGFDHLSSLFSGLVLRPKEQTLPSRRLVNLLFLQHLNRGVVEARPFPRRLSPWIYLPYKVNTTDERTITKGMKTNKELLCYTYVSWSATVGRG